MVLRIHVVPKLKQLPVYLFVFQHPLLVKTLYIFHDMNKIFYLTEKINGVHFLEFIQKRRSEVPEDKLEDIVKFYSIQLISVLDYFEGIGYIER